MHALDMYGETLVFSFAHELGVSVPLLFGAMIRQKCYKSGYAFTGLASD